MSGPSMTCWRAGAAEVTWPLRYGRTPTTPVCLASGDEVLGSSSVRLGPPCGHEVFVEMPQCCCTCVAVKEGRVYHTNRMLSFYAPGEPPPFADSKTAQPFQITEDFSTSWCCMAWLSSRLTETTIVSLGHCLIHFTELLNTIDLCGNRWSISSTAVCTRSRAHQFMLEPRRR
ncbi:unnamed protein product [Triticum turgidum subsp. durum]|uniref:Uncharacterized protein n=1 Tax=Triticum turgidum subsp. durum TaxID=4567 RepID=A0A9R1NQA0_TRITD|nr:unnamed protein product [Triticum turgidum subsp. durum]